LKFDHGNIPKDTF